MSPTPSITVPSFLQGSFKISPSVNFQNVDGHAFWLRSEQNGGKFVHQSKRAVFGLSATPTLFALFPGFGPITRFRHSITPVISYSYAPTGNISSEFLRALNKSKQGYLGALKAFRTSRVRLTSDAVYFTARQPGADMSALVRIVPATDRPFVLDVQRASLGWIPLPAMLVNWVVRHYDPTPQMKSRLPFPVEIGRVTVTEQALRIGEPIAEGERVGGRHRLDAREAERREHSTQQSTSRGSSVLPGVQRREDPRAIVIARATRDDELDCDRGREAVHEGEATDHDEEDRIGTQQREQRARGGALDAGEDEPRLGALEQRVAVGAAQPRDDIDQISKRTHGPVPYLRHLVVASRLQGWLG